jgi:hypothetical protein
MGIFKNVTPVRVMCFFLRCGCEKRPLEADILNCEF